MGPGFELVRPGAGSGEADPAARQGPPDWCLELVQDLDAVVWQAEAESLRFTFVSRHAERILGYPLRQWYEGPGFWLELLHPDDRERAQSECRRAIAERRGHSSEYRVVTADGRVLWVRDHVRMGVDEAGTAMLRGVMVDVTEQKRVETALRESEERLRHIFDNTPAGMVTLAPTGTVLAANPAFLRLVGRPAPELTSASLEHLVHPEDRAELHRQLREVRVGDREALDLEIRFARPDGAVAWARASGSFLRDKAGLPRQCIAVTLDVTGRRRSEERLRGLLAAAQRLTANLEVDALLDHLVEGAAGLVHAEGGCAGLLGPDGMRIDRYFQGGGWTPAMHAWPAGAGLPGWVALHRRPYTTNDAGRDPQISPDFREMFAVRSALCVPILDDREEVMAFFELDNGAAPGFTAEDEAIVATMARGASISIRNALAYRRIQEAEAALRRSEGLYRTLARNFPSGVVCLFDRNLRFTLVEGAGLADIGFSKERAESRTVWEVLPPEGAAALEPVFRAVFLGARSSVEIGCRSSIYSFAVVPVQDRPGEVLGGMFVGQDITERKHAERALRFLSEAGTALASSLDYERTMEQVARLAVPFLADYCVVDVIEEDGAVRRLAAAHAYRERDVLARDLLRFPPDPTVRRGVPEVLRSGRPCLVREISPAELAAMARSPEHLMLLEELAPRSVMFVPLRARGRTLGAITFAYAESGRTYHWEDVNLAEELARAAALAVDNSRLYRRQKEIARALQEGLLPSRLPEIPGLEAAACYRPAGTEIEVGGDFYDLFRSGDDAWTVVIGDVTGKGPAAAAVTALARHTARTAAQFTRLPSQALRSINQAMLAQEAADRWCTVQYARLEALGNGARMTVSSAGHPLPLLLRRDGGVEPVGRPGMILGFLPVPPLFDDVCELRPGDAVVLYTDGVTEARRNGELFGDERLVEIVSQCVGLGAVGIANRIEREVAEFQGGKSRDDLAIVALRVRPR